MREIQERCDFSFWNQRVGEPCVHSDLRRRIAEISGDSKQRFQKEIEFAKAVKNQRFPPWPTLPVLPPMTWAASSESGRFDFTAWPPVAPCLVEL
jgi:hypothetical protein